MSRLHSVEPYRMLRVAALTSSRADFGIQQGLFQKICKDKRFEFNLFVTQAGGAQRVAEIEEVKRSGIPIYAFVGSDSETRRADSMSAVTASIMLDMSRHFEACRPDVFLVLGDRFEIMGAGLAAFHAGITIAHLHGGEKSSGSIDDPTRHAITKLADVHLTSHNDYAARVLQLGEHPSDVHVVGALGAKPLPADELLSKQELEQTLALEFASRLFLVSFHPETKAPDGGIGLVRQLLDVLGELKDSTLIFTGVNADPFGDRIQDLILEFCRKRPKTTKNVSNLGRLLFHSCLSQFDCLVGNSSSGLLESSSYGIPTVDLGSRQHGRIRADNVIHVESGSQNIRKAINKALSVSFRNSLRNMTNPFLMENQEERILEILANASSGRVAREFQDNVNAAKL